MLLDEIDKKILNMLLQSGRISYTDIAKAVDMKPPSVIDRIKKLEHEGIIKGYTTSVDYKKLGYDLTAFIGIVIDNPDHISQLEGQLNNIDEGIVRCYHVTGDFTLILQVITENTNTLAAIINHIRAMPGVIRSNTILIFSTMLDRVRQI
ncbi:MAG: Lrp/AsnC family transcriptional regulator [Deferribacteraceae bacterium]|jgi:Lrp/AsnC family leucine-responsive transcriptional regulator|nr:Lrp/AsnC family transcriptional regulator [Deferribacteraceae bacterium]